MRALIWILVIHYFANGAYIVVEVPHGRGPRQYLVNGADVDEDEKVKKDEE